ncbi:MAG: hypothetical protein ACR2IP_09470 [Solirubrobacteraceae bacterium]
MRSGRIDGFELIVLVVFAAVSVWVLGLDLWQVVARGRVWTGTDGIYLVDQMQYLAWIQDASRHLLAANLFVLTPTPADYLQPGVALSGGLTALGVAPWLSLLLWKPVAVGGAFYAVRQYAHRCLRSRESRRAALVLGLFFGSFTIIYGSFGVVGDLFAGFLSWGYTFGLVALAAMLLALLRYDRARSANRVAWAPPLLGVLTSSMHPWQGELLILILLGGELAVCWRRVRARGPRRPAPRSRARVKLLAVTVIATAVPLAYYGALGLLDGSWHLAREASKHSFSLWTVVLALAPLALPAALGYRGAPRTFILTVTRVWPIAALGVFLLSGSVLGATPLHAFEGVTIPLAVLAVQGFEHWRIAGGRRGAGQKSGRRIGVGGRRLLGSLAIVAATIPASGYELYSARALVAPSAGNAGFITADERRALRYLAHDPRPGGVLSRFYLGAVLPALTGRRTFVGDCLWSQPACTARAKSAQRLLRGSLTPAATGVLVLGSGARFVLADCQSSPDLARRLGPFVSSMHRFGCATVYVVG